MSLLKDEILKNLSERVNVANFASFAPDGTFRYSPDRELAEKIHASPKTGIGEAAKTLLGFSGRVNIRSFREEKYQGNPFYFNLMQSDEIFYAAKKLMDMGFYIILNECLPLDDGGASGVIDHGFVEVAPGATPRCVEDAGCSLLPAFWAERMLSLLCQAPIRLPQGDARYEFSVHPLPCGVRKEHVVIWEETKSAGAKDKRDTFLRESDPFSRFLGDKAYGLLLADTMGAPVPKTTLFLRGSYVPLMLFGRDTGEKNVWTRTCPRERTPGKFSTLRGFHDPFALMEADDPEGKTVASAIIQQEVKSEYAGVASFDEKGCFCIEGIEGFGDDFMQGKASPAALPEKVREKVRDEIGAALGFCGALHVEWALDKNRVWVLQFHTSGVSGDGNIIVPGEANFWYYWEPSMGLECLRQMAKEVKERKGGIEISAAVGVLSHAADILRKEGVAARREAR